MIEPVFADVQIELVVAAQEAVLVDIAAGEGKLRPTLQCHGLQILIAVTEIRL